MTEEQKESLMGRMLDSPASLSREEADLILNDGELRELYDISRRLRDTYAPATTVDTAGEWRAFRKHLAKTRLRRLVTASLRAVAVFTGIAVLSGAIVFTLNRPNSSTSEPTLLADAGEAISPIIVSAPPPTPVETIPREPSGSHKPEPTPTKTRHHTARPTDEADVEAYLRLMRARIDNEIAMQMAEIYANINNTNVIMP